ncbi:MAG: 30S ribosomal protein S21 [Crenarchaeota archaeon]|nr:MAG: 30S ribosomal protein S21 [Thermoproteota archaeon]
MSVTRIRVVSKNANSNASRYEQERAFKSLFGAFKKQVNESGILTRYKECQFFESKSEKQRRKKKEAEAQRQKELQTRLREHFG